MVRQSRAEQSADLRDCMNKVPGPSDTNLLTAWVTRFLERANENSKVVFVIDPQHVSKQKRESGGRRGRAL